MKTSRQVAIFGVVGLSFVVVGIASLTRGYPTEIFPDGTTIRYPKINWQQEIGGKWYAIQQYPKGAYFPCLAANSMSTSSLKKFADIRTERGTTIYVPRREGASSVVTSVQIANRSYNLPVRFEFCAILLGLLILLVYPVLRLLSFRSRVEQCAPCKNDSRVGDS